MSDYVVTIDGDKFDIKNSGSKIVTINDKKCSVDILKLSDHTFKLIVDNKVFHVTSNQINGNSHSFLIDGHYIDLVVRTKLEEEAAKILNNKNANSGEIQIKSPMPGLILRINKNIGETVSKGESLVLLEAMKMENEIKSTVSGTIKEVVIDEGSSVEKNQLLLSIKIEDT